MAAPAIVRALDPGEAFFTLSDQVSGMNFVVFAERNGSLEPEHIHTALDAVQREHLMLQTSVQWAGEQGLCFCHAPAATIELRCHDVQVTDWQRPIEQQLSEPFPIGSAPLMRCLYLTLLDAADASADKPKPSRPRGVLALCFHHAIADGRSGTALLRQVLERIAQPETTPTAAAATSLPAMLALHPKGFRWAEQADAAKQLKGTLIGDYRRHGAPAPLPWLAAQASERTPKFIRLSFSADVTAALLNTARAKGASVHGALCAAQLLAQTELHGAGEASTFCLSSPVDMRPHLDPVPPTSPTGMFASIVSATFALDTDTDFWALAQQIVTQTRTQLARGEGHLFFSMFGLNGAPVMPEHQLPLTQKVMASLPNTMISNVGVVATISADPAVTAISFALCPMPYQSLFTAASTYQGCLVLNVGFDAARLSPAHAQALATGIQSRLLAAL